ncbi:MAG: hypothetical protein ACYC8W_00705 [Candidatus Tyrphobacter sp.]
MWNVLLRRCNVTSAVYGIVGVMGDVPPPVATVTAPFASVMVDGLAIDSSAGFYAQGLSQADIQRSPP